MKGRPDDDPDAGGPRTSRTRWAGRCRAARLLQEIDTSSEDWCTTPTPDIEDGRKHARRRCWVHFCNRTAACFCSVDACVIFPGGTMGLPRCRSVPPPKWIERPQGVALGCPVGLAGPPAPLRLVSTRHQLPRTVLWGQSTSTTSRCPPEVTTPVL